MFSYVLTALLLLFVMYATVGERLQLRWGAKADELAMNIPGDELVRDPNLISTRALTINAPIEKVWPWLAQLGQGKGGMYSYEFLENLIGCDMHNADTINPAWQDIKVGDVVELDGKGRAPGMPVVVVDLGKTLILGGEQWLWTLHLIKFNNNTTRLVSRSRASWTSFKEGLPNRYVLQPISFIMERKMLLGIKRRAERS